MLDGAGAAARGPVGAGCAADRVCHGLQIGLGDLVQPAVAPDLFESVQMGAIGTSRTGFKGRADRRDDFGERRYRCGRSYQVSGRQPHLCE